MTTSTPPVTINVSDTGDDASGFTFGVDSFSISPPGQDDMDTVFGDDQDEFENFHYSPFHVQQSCDGDAPMSHHQFKLLRENLNTLYESSKPSSSSE